MTRSDTPSSQPSSGFTLIEILVVITILVILFAASLVNLGKPQETANIATTIDTLVADIKAQQIQSMSGDTGSTTTAQLHGIYLEASQFTLFAGSTYSSSDPNNFVESLPTTIRLTTTIPSAQLIFVKGTGEVQGYTAGNNTITLTSANATHTITVGRYGATTVN